MGLRFSEICIDARDPEALGAWWSEVLGWPAHTDADGDVILTRRPAPARPGCSPRAGGQGGQNRLHPDFTRTISRPRWTG